MEGGQHRSAQNPKRKNPFEGVTAEKYAKMLKAYLTLEAPTVVKIAKQAGVGETMVKRALSGGWPKLGLPPLGDAADSLVEPEEVHALMNGMAEAKKTIVENIFGSKQEDSKGGVNPAAVDEAQARVAEAGMAARVSLSNSVRTARAVERLAEKILEKIENDEIDLPDQVRLEHIFLLAKAADTSAAAIHKSIQTERLKNGQPETIVGQQIVNLLATASPEELRFIMENGGNLPPTMLGLKAAPALPPVKPSDDAEVIDVEEVKP